jgi:hypothetical protein
LIIVISKQINKLLKIGYNVSLLQGSMMRLNGFDDERNMGCDKLKNKPSFPRFSNLERILN